ncbi:hypothetical protein D1818_05440 [Aquimarina sp. BL5]|uniref:hypothetical protein n=1 Tax=Aquimarina sp. BL5 TaxID=1714860 RepID=UPI000E4E7529|nr:hypothetical protein [Aquimarina sp. BL5]AXT50299.1 hypothetical protein D1818_05440 [Aquimarina sp. BL5]RKN01790.1 hypothetical protein D7036_17405 [Aquimarina sp. BL5]
MKTFEGTWVDFADQTILVTEHKRKLEVRYDNGQGPFYGQIVNFYSFVINVDFEDLSPSTGVLSDDENVIFWSNATKWMRADTI